MKRFYIIALTLILVSSAYAQIPPGQWLCYAFDSREKSYEGLGKSVKQAMSQAKASCSKRSKYSKSCKTAQSYCQQGPLSLIEDRCIVTDSSGRTWNATGKNACDSALAMCNRWQYLHGKMNQCSVKHP